MNTFDLKNYKKTKLLIDSVFAFQKSEDYYSLILMGGAVKGGKTYSSLGCAVLLCNTYPGCAGVVVRKTSKVIERNLLPVWYKLDWLANAKRIKKKEGDYVIDFYNGSRLLFIAENYQNDKELNALRGLDINFYIMEEGNELQEHTWNKLNERNGTNRHTCDIPPMAIITCNPTWAWLKEKIYDRFENKTAPKKWLFIPSTARDNPAIPESQFENWRETLSPYDYRVFIEGNWGVEKKVGAFLKCFEPDKHLTAIDFNPDLPIHVTFDENVLPYITCSLFQVFVDKKTIVQVAELPCRPPNNSAEKMGIILNKWLQENNFKDKIFVYGDATSQKKSTLGKSFFVQILDQLKFHYETRILKRNESVALTGAFVNLMLEAKFSWKILINEKCGISISDYIDTLEDENGGIKKNRVTDGLTGLSFEKNGHFTDAFRYFVVSIFHDLYRSFKKAKLQ